jgi:dihydroorotate dehydrogenase electron transfer subunit
MQIKDVPGEVVFNKEAGTRIFHLRLKVKNFSSSKPGQFVMLNVGEGNFPILRRPFAIFNQEENFIEVGYRVIGEGTKTLAQKRKGEKVKVLGPLGNGFKITGVPSLIIAGGIGIASVFHLIKKIGKNATVLFGAKNKNELVFIELIRKTGAKVLFSTEDGSYGKKGLVTTMLTDELLSKFKCAYACGPLAMLRKVAEIAEKHNIDCQVSLETKMACGFGVCLGCVVPVKNSVSEEKEYLRVCTDGPVFNTRIVNWKLFE